MAGRKILFIILGGVGGLVALWVLVLVCLVLWGMINGLSVADMRKAAVQHKAAEERKALTTTGIPIVSERSPLTPLDKEAAEQGLERWKLTKLGESHFVQNISEMGRTVVELRNPRISVSAEPLSEADKLNGKEWRGRMTLCSDATRTYSAKNGQYPPASTWTEWRTDFDIPAKYEKIHGKWSVNDAAAMTKSSFKTVEASDLPK